MGREGTDGFGREGVLRDGVGGPFDLVVEGRTGCDC
jgi:hypothetical protein